MNREEFLTRLEAELSKLPERERREVLRFYMDYIDDADDKDKVIDELGSPKDIARKIIEDYDTFTNEPEAGHAAPSDSDELPYFKSIKSNIRNGAFILKRGNIQSIDVKYKHEKPSRIYYRVEHEKLIIEQERPRFRWFYTENTVPTVITVTLTDEKYDEFKLHSTGGTISLGGIAVKDVYIESLNGAITLNSMLIGEIHAENVNGGMNLSDIKTLSANLETVNGALTVENTECDRLIAKNVNGPVRLSGKLSGKVYAETVNGSINVKTAFLKEDFDWDLETVSGAIYVGGERFKRSVRNKTGAENMIKCETVNGSITVDFEEL